MSQIHKQIDGLMAALTDPIIVFDPSWADVLPDWLKGEIKLQRLVQLMKGEEGIATDAEALAYVSNAALAVPLASGGDLPISIDQGDERGSPRGTEAMAVETEG